MPRHLAGAFPVIRRPRPAPRSAAGVPRAARPAARASRSPTTGLGRSLAGCIGGIAAASALLTGLLLPATAALAQQRQSVPVVRDAEIEDLLRDYANPLFQAAGLGAARPEVILVDRDDFNAFVADRDRIFIHTAVLAQADTPNEVIGVLAHETGHIAGNHLARLRDAIRRAQIIGGLTALAGIGAIAAGAASGSADLGRTGAGAIAGGASVAEKTFLAYARGEERSADAAALRYLEATGQSARGMLVTFQRLADQQLFSARFADPYALSHPLARDRVTQLDTLARQSPYFDRKDPPELQFRHDMAKAKLAAFTQHPRTVQRRYPRSDRSLPAQYARAIIAYRTGKPREADKAIDALIAQDPDNPYFWELKGQAWLEAGRPELAIAPLERAVSLAPRPGLMRIMLGHALVSTERPEHLARAISELERGLDQEPNAGIGYRALGLAYARAGDTGKADLASARMMIVSGRIEEARRYADRAQQKLKRGSPGWLQARDIVEYKPPSFLE